MERSEFDWGEVTFVWGEMTGGKMTMGRNPCNSELQLIKSANAILRHPSHNMQTVKTRQLIVFVITPCH